MRRERHYDLEGTMISKKYKFIFVHINKCAGVSVKNALDKKCRCEFSGHRPITRFREVYPEIFGECFKFTFVRNPLARLASGYLNKFVRDRFDSEQWEHTSPTLQRIFGANAHPLAHSISFVQFVEHVCETPDQQLDKHWRPMHTFLNLDLDLFIGRVETISRDFDTIRQRVGLPAGLTQENKTDRAEGSELPADEYWAMAADDLRALPSLPKTG